MIFGGIFVVEKGDIFDCRVTGTEGFDRICALNILTKIPLVF